MYINIYYSYTLYFPLPSLMGNPTPNRIYAMLVYGYPFLSRSQF